VVVFKYAVIEFYFIFGAMKPISYQVYKRTLQFSFDAKTSRGSLQTHDAYILKGSTINGLIGWGEASPLKGLSIDAEPNFESKLIDIVNQLNQGTDPRELDLEKLPAIQFAIETLKSDIANGGKMELFASPFLNGKPIYMNGLVWMNTPENMLQEAIKKVEAGYDCIKFKIGAYQHDEECKMLEQFRKLFDANKVEIRLDANGAFAADEAVIKLKDLNQFTIHSIEQPIAPKQIEAMQEICAKSPIPVALDEELIGLNPLTDGKKILPKIGAKYLILKPTLLGGLSATEAWIAKANEYNMHWWTTSALESNIGLNAIAQFTATKNNKLPQGLGTGALYLNNFDTPLLAEKGFLHYIAAKKWAFPNASEELILNLS
jgi:o-succinylbenzoate synthase